MIIAGVCFGRSAPEAGPSKACQGSMEAQEQVETRIEEEYGHY
jgi:hypothetical protein